MDGSACFWNGNFMDKDTLHRWTLKRLNLNSIMAENLLEYGCIPEENETPDDLAAGNDFWKLPEYSYFYEMNQTDSDGTVTEKPVLKFGMPRVGPNGDIVPGSFRTLVRAKSKLSPEEPYSKKFSGSEWDLANGTA